MKKFDKKYISLKDASIVSGYTQAELRNFAKIGLIPFLKKKNLLFIRFDAFERLNGKQDETKNKNGKNSSSKKSIAVRTPGSLIPFTQPHPTLVKVLEPVAFAAALLMMVHIASIPEASTQMIRGITLSQNTINYMAGTFSDLLEAGVSVPLAAGAKVASVSTLSASLPVASATVAPTVAGVSTTADTAPITTVSLSIDGSITQTLIAIADGAEMFNSFLQNLSLRTSQFLIEPYQFSNIDSGLQQFFRL